MRARVSSLGNLLLQGFVATGLAALMVTTPAAAVTAYPGVVGAIAYVPAGSFDIWRMQSDGSQRVRLVICPSGHTCTQPTWSPQGTRLAYDDNGALTVIGADCSAPVTLATGVADEPPAWSADGSRLAFQVSNGISVVNADGTGRQDLLPGSGPTWSPDGTKLAFASTGGVVVIDFVHTPITVAASDAHHVDWSPSGSALVYDDGDSIRSVNADGSGVQTLATVSSALLREPLWSPDGTKIAFQSIGGADPTAWDTWVMGADGTGKVNLGATDPADQAHARWSPGGAQIVVSGATTASGSIRILNADGTGTATQIGDGVVGSWAVSPPGGLAGCPHQTSTGLVLSTPNPHYGRTTYVTVSVLDVTGARNGPPNDIVVPLGTVTYRINGGAPRTIPINPTGPTRIALPATTLPGAYVVTASYGGGGVDQPSVAVPLRVIVAPGYTTTSRAFATYSPVGGRLAGYVGVRFTAGTVDPGWSRVPAGAVRIYEGRVLRAYGTLVGGRVRLVLPRLSRGWHTLTARYLGDTRTRGSLVTFRMYQR